MAQQYMDAICQYAKQTTLGKEISDSSTGEALSSSGQNPSSRGNSRRS